MIIAVPYQNGEIFQHFGHTEAFKLYGVQDGAVVTTQIAETGGSGHGARTALAQAGVRPYPRGTGGAGKAAGGARRARVVGEIARAPLVLGAFRAAHQRQEGRAPPCRGPPYQFFHICPSLLRC